MINIGIIGAMDKEIESLLNRMKIESKDEINNTVFYICRYKKIKLILVKSGIGKVNSAIITQLLISKYEPKYIINTGIAGAISKDVKVLDIVIASETLQYDFDVTNFGYKLGQIPQMDKYIFKTDKYLIELMKKVLGEKERYHIGRIISGDKFISNNKDKEFLFKEFNGLCADMESGSIGHVCYINSIPYIAVRCISDNADETSAENYKDFDSKAANKSSDLILSLLNKV
jgi:adenosylhomocysteine nucleosidase